jgi:hypothetical protein
MTQEDYRHPIAPPPELVQQWIDAPHDIGLGCHPARSVPNETYAKRLIEAAQWGADQELEACCHEVQNMYSGGSRLCAARRKPPSLKEQALALIDGCSNPDNDYLDDDALATIRRALEQLDD